MKSFVNNSWRFSVESLHERRSLSVEVKGVKGGGRSDEVGGGGGRGAEDENAGEGFTESWAATPSF